MPAGAMAARQQIISAPPVVRGSVKGGGKAAQRWPAAQPYAQTKGKGKGTAAEANVCSIHGKKRGASSLIPDAWGYFQCFPGQECKMGAGDVTPVHHPSIGKHVDMAVCSVHGKKRSASVLESDGYRGWRCVNGQECKGGKEQGEEPKQLELGVCTQHNKQRNINVLRENENGELVCMEEKMCKESTRVEGEEATILENGLGPREMVQCSAHNKRRKADAVVLDGFGGYVCTQETECQISVSLQEPQAAPRMQIGYCSVHGKNRSMGVLEDDGAGGYQCMPDKQCKC